MFTVLERRPISEELAVASERWLAKYRLSEVDEAWLELVCEDGETFTADKVLLHVAVPPAEVVAGDALEVGRTQTVGEAWPLPGAPKNEVPRSLALARTIEREAGGWVAACELPGAVRELFTVEDPAAMLAVMNSTRRTLGRGLLGIAGDPAGRLTFTMVEGDMVARASIEATVSEEFAYWLDSGPAAGLAGPLDGARRVTGSLGAMSDLILVDEKGVEARCFLEDDRAGPVAFEPGGATVTLRVERAEGLGREALGAISGLRPGEVTLTAGADGSLVISGAASDFTVAGPGVETDRPGAPVVVPYLAALALYDGAAGGPVEIAVDAGGGRLHRSDLGLTLEWRR